MTKIEEIDLKNLSDEGFIKFTIRAEDNEYNESIHKAFRDFCYHQTRNDYTKGLKFLLEQYDVMRQIGMLWGAIDVIEGRLDKLKDDGPVKVSPELKKEIAKEEERGAF